MAALPSAAAALEVEVAAALEEQAPAALPAAAAALEEQAEERAVAAAVLPAPAPAFSGLHQMLYAAVLQRCGGQLPQSMGSYFNPAAPPADDTLFQLIMTLQMLGFLPPGWPAAELPPLHAAAVAPATAAKVRERGGEHTYRDSTRTAVLPGLHCQCAEPNPSAHDPPYPTLKHEALAKQKRKAPAKKARRGKKRGSKAEQ